MVVGSSIFVFPIVASDRPFLRSGLQSCQTWSLGFVAVGLPGKGVNKSSCLTCVDALGNGHMTVFDWAVENGFDWDPDDGCCHSCQQR